MTEEELHIKDVYVHFGLASYMAQCLERSIAMVLVFVYGKGPTEITRIELDQVLSKTFRKTMGQLIKELKHKNNTDLMEVEIDLALEKRNWLIHNYFYDRAGHFMTQDGRDLMIDELIEIRGLLEKIDNFLEIICDEKIESFGVSKEKIQEYMRNFLAFQA